MKIPLLLLRNLYSSTTYLGWNSHWIEAVLAWTWIWLPEFSWVHFHGPKRRFYVCKLRWTHFFELSKWWGIHSFFYLGGKAKHSLLDSSSSSSSIGGVPTTAPPQSSGSISIFHLYQIEQDSSLALKRNDEGAQIFIDW